MQLTIPDSIADEIQRLVDSGRFSSAEEVLAAAIDALHYDLDSLPDEGDAAYWAEVKAGIEEAEADYAAGRYFELNDSTESDFIARIMRRQHSR